MDAQHRQKQRSQNGRNPQRAEQGAPQQQLPGLTAQREAVGVFDLIHGDILAFCFISHDYTMKYKTEGSPGGFPPFFCAVKPGQVRARPSTLSTTPVM